MKGEIFQYDQCQLIESDNIPKGLRIYMGVDLAITEKEVNDQFAIVILGMDPDKNRYVLDFYANHLRFGAQTRKIIEYYNKWDPIRCCIETNAYQLAQYQNLKDDHDKDMRLKKVQQDKDKIARAWKLEPQFEDMRMFFKKGGNMHLLIEQLVLFPNFKYKDLFDALDLANRASKLKKRRGRRREPGVI
jgi:predicted phage terminase large subunit-like protein